MISQLKGQLPDHEAKVITSDGSPGKMFEVVAPLVVQSGTSVVHIGSGFFCTQFGIFITAAHVVVEARKKIEQHGGHLGLVQFTRDNLVFFRPVVRTTHHPTADVAVGFALGVRHPTTNEPTKSGAVIVTEQVALPGSHVVAYGYPKTQIEYEQTTIVNLRPGFFRGVVCKYHEGGRDSVMMPGPCYETTLHAYGGSSGGPVFNDEGVVIALTSTGIEGEGISFSACIRAALDLPIQEVQFPGEQIFRTTSLRELATRGFARVI